MNSGGSHSPTLQRWTFLQHPFTSGWMQGLGLGLWYSDCPRVSLQPWQGWKALGRDPKCMCRGHFPIQVLTPSRRLELLGCLLRNVDRADLE